MVGRDRELELLRSIYRTLGRGGRPQPRHRSTATRASARAGSSREFVGWAERHDPAPTIVRGRCLPYGDGVTYWPLAEILKGLAGICDTDPTEVALETDPRARDAT